MFLEILFLFMLGLTAIVDIRHRKIPNYLVIIMLAIGLASFVISGSPIQRLIGIIFPAGVLWAFSKRQHIGSGDIKLTMAVGLYYGYLQAAIMLIGALLIIVCYARLFLKSTKRAKAKTVPFAPFITVICLIGFIYKHTLL